MSMILQLSLRDVREELGLNEPEELIDLILACFEAWGYDTQIEAHDAHLVQLDPHGLTFEQWYTESVRMARLVARIKTAFKEQFNALAEIDQSIPVLKCNIHHVILRLPA